MTATLTPVRPRVDVIESEFEEACEVCHVRPTAAQVRIAEPDEVLREDAMATWPQRVTRRFFCAEHIGAVNELVDSYRT
jgi:hypothetical protein